MLDVQEIKKQDFIDCEDMTRDEASKSAHADRWTPHVEDGLDAFAREIHKAETEKWSRVIAQASSDADFRQCLSENLAEAVKPFGISVPAGVNIRLVENTASVRHLVLPPPASVGTAGAGRSEIDALAASVAHATSTAQLPKTWADTWQADLPTNPGRPV